MLKRTIFFDNAAYLSTKDEQLVVRYPDTEANRTVPIEDIGYVVLNHPQITLTHGLLQKLSANNCAVIICNEKHLPEAMLLNLDSHYIQNERFRHQLAASEPLKKNLWQQTVKAKIKNQAACLAYFGHDATALKRIAKDVISGDATNREGYAAKKYWHSLLGDDFRRDRYGATPNNALNYIYAVLRAAVARGLMASGLLPTLGIHHHNRYNAFCLADDVMEPYRPIADVFALSLYDDDFDEILTTDDKLQILQILDIDVMWNKKQSPLQVSITKTCYQLAQCFEGNKKKLIYPTLMPNL